MLSFSPSIANKPELKGELAAKKRVFGSHSQYAVAPVYTRFEAVEWFVWNVEKPNEYGLPEVIRQAPTLEQAVSGIY